MAANTHMVTVAAQGAGTWIPLSSVSLVLARATAFVWVSGAVGGALSIRVTGTTMDLPKDTNFSLDGVDLATVDVSGDAAFRMTVIGNSD